MTLNIYLLAQLSDLGTGPLLFVFILYLGIPVGGLVWLGRMAWRRRTTMRELLLFVTYWGVWCGLYVAREKIARMIFS
jgi:hypothetical protein